MEDLDFDFDQDFDNGLDDSDMNQEMLGIDQISSSNEELVYGPENINSEIDSIDSDSESLLSDNTESDTDTYHGEVSFKGHTQSEIDAKYHKAEMEYGHAKADYQRHMDLAKTGTMPNNDELAHARDAYRRMETAQKEMYKWKYTHPDKK